MDVLRLQINFFEQNYLAVLLNNVCSPPDNNSVKPLLQPDLFLPRQDFRNVEEDCLGPLSSISHPFRKLLLLCKCSTMLGLFIVHFVHIHFE